MLQIHFSLELEHCPDNPPPVSIIRNDFIALPAEATGDILYKNAVTSVVIGNVPCISDKRICATVGAFHHPFP
ncbi:hypothetical protein ABIE33_005906 [Ensifer sp. 4252]